MRRTSRSAYFPYHAQPEEEERSSYSQRQLFPPTPASSSARHAQRELFAERERALAEREEREQRLGELAALSQGVQFPHSTAVLWDRRGLTAPRSVRCEQVLPPLVLSRTDIGLLLSLLQQSQQGNEESTAGSAEVIGSVYTVAQLSETHCQVLANNPASLLLASSSSSSSSSSAVRSNLYGLVLEPTTQRASYGRGESALDLSLTIPVVRRADLAFDENNTEFLKTQLWKTLRSGRSFALKHFLRLRAVGNASPSPSSSSLSPSRRRKGVVRFEAILPDLSFQFVGIAAIPILATPLALSLLSSASSHTQQETDSLFATIAEPRPVMGFVTLNQTRKAVFLLESDSHALSRIPVVGVFLRLAETDVSISEGGWEEAVQHPLCWAACVRFLCSEKIVERVFVAPDTFLMMLIVGDAVQCFEGCVDRRAFSLSAESRVRQGCDFVSMDFTAELSVENETGEARPELDPLDSLVCRFRSKSLPQSPPHAQGRIDSSFSPSLSGPAWANNHLRSSRELQRERERDTEEERPRPAPTPLRAPLRSSWTTERETHMYAHTPVYAEREAESERSAAACFSSLLNAEKSEQLSQLSQPSLIAEQRALTEAHWLRPNHTPLVPGHVLGIPAGPLSYAFPAQVVSAQQRQIEALQREVEQLRAMLLSLSPSLTLPPSASSSPTPPPPLSQTQRDRESDSISVTRERGDDRKKAAVLEHTSARRVAEEVSSISSTRTLEERARTLSAVQSERITPPSDERRTEYTPESTQEASSLISTASHTAAATSTAAPVALNVIATASDVDIETDAADLDETDTIDAQYWRTQDDKREVLDRLVPNLQQLPMQTIALSQAQPSLLLRLSDEEVLVGSLTHDDEDYDNNGGVTTDKPSGQENQNDIRASFQKAVPASLSTPQTDSVRAPRSTPSSLNRQFLSHRSVRYTHHLPSQSNAVRFAEEEASHFYESESILAIQTKYMAPY